MLSYEKLALLRWGRIFRVMSCFFLSGLFSAVQDVLAKSSLLLISNLFQADYQVFTVDGDSLAPKRGQALNRDEELDYQATPPAHEPGAGKLIGIICLALKSKSVRVLNFLTDPV